MLDMILFTDLGDLIKLCMYLLVFSITVFYFIIKRLKIIYSRIKSDICS